MDQTVADRFFAAITQGDIAALRGLYNTEARIWHNDEPHTEQTVDDNLRTLRWLAANVKNFRYDAIRRYPLDRGFVQQHVLRGDLPDGQQIEVHACLFVWTEREQIVRIEEYVDTAAIEPLRALARLGKAARGSR